MVSNGNINITWFDDIHKRCLFKTIYKILLFIIVMQTTVYSQIDNLDSTFNAFERMYRNKLNKSDTIFVESIINKIKKSDCNCLNNYFLSHAISGTIKKK